MQMLRTVDQVRAFRRVAPDRLAFVPTMGALHAGHLAHVAVARTAGAADRVLVSVFVNPTQFGPHEDLDRYPRTPEQDLAACREAGVDAVFLPDVDTLYPPDVPACPVGPPAVADDLEGARRPGHFAGVCRVVLKLLQLVQPDVLTLGRKDYQQLCVLRAMVQDLFVPVDVLAVPTVREPDGLALSSRNRRLAPAARPRARGLSQALRAAAALAATDETDPAAAEAAMRTVLDAHRLRTDYAVVRHHRTLRPVDTLNPGRCVALIAAYADAAADPDGDGHNAAESAAPPRVRLIDNARLDEPPPAPSTG